jgi:hypothetical protein
MRPGKRRSRQLENAVGLSQHLKARSLVVGKPSNGTMHGARSTRALIFNIGR